MLKMAGENSKPRKRTPKHCTLNCEWENCQSSTTLLPSDYETFSDHLKVHADEFVSRLQNEAGTQDDKPISCCCMWRACSWEGCEDLMELIRHIMFHGYHALLKALGMLEQMKLNLSPCTIEVDDQYQMFSCVTGSFICCWNACNTEYLCPDKYYRHIEKHVLDSNFIYIDKNEVRMQCHWDTCTNHFRDKHKLKEHVRVHSHEKLMACASCGGLFSNRTKLLDHLSRQNVEAYENFQCSHCLKRCASERLLRDHMRHHVNYLKCPHCDMTCPNPGSLKYHIHYRHSDERPFPCNMCEQSFKSNSDLIRHEESHLPKSYVCTVKGCSFTTKTSHCLRRHVKMTHTDHGVKRYICHICNRGYSRGFGLTKHLKKQHNFSWPSGHPRFRYIEYEDGLFRLQMVRFESAELTKRLQTEGVTDDDDYGDDLDEVDEEHIQYEEELQQENITQFNAEGEQVVYHAIEHDDHNAQYEKSEQDVEHEESHDVASTAKETVVSQEDIGNYLPEITVSSAKVQIAYGDINSAMYTYVQPPEERNGSKSTTVQSSTSNTVSSRGDIYLQPKPPGYDGSIMSQILALSSKQGSQFNSTANSVLVSNLYQCLRKTSKERDEDCSQHKITVEPDQEHHLSDTEVTNEVVFDQVAYQLDNEIEAETSKEPPNKAGDHDAFLFTIESAQPSTKNYSCSRQNFMKVFGDINGVKTETETDNRENTKNSLPQSLAQVKESRSRKRQNSTGSTQNTQSTSTFKRKKIDSIDRSSSSPTQPKVKGRKELSKEKVKTFCESLTLNNSNNDGHNNQDSKMVKSSLQEKNDIDDEMDQKLDVSQVLLSLKSTAK